MAGPPSQVAIPAPAASPAPTASFQPEPPSQPITTFAARTREFVAELFATWPGGLVPNHYPDTVMYYGKTVPREAVLAEKKQFMARWPQRSYVMQLASVQCDEYEASGPLCHVVAQAAWSVSNGTKSASGNMTVTYQIKWWSHSFPKILLETSETVRDPTPSATLLPPQPTKPTQPTDWLSSIFKQQAQ
jgi:hypothetical protein